MQVELQLARELISTSPEPRAACLTEGILNSPFICFLKSIQCFCSCPNHCPCSHGRTVWTDQHTHFHFIGNGIPPFAHWSSGLGTQKGQTWEVVFCPICRVKRLPSSADVFHGRRSKQPSPSHLELTAESVGCLHTLQHGYSLRVQGWSAPDHQQRSASVPEGPVTHGAPA